MRARARSAAIGLGLLAAASAARADDACDGAREEARRARGEGRYTHALARLAECARACPEEARRACEVERDAVLEAAPRVSVAVRDAADGRDLPGARVRVDGEPLPPSAEGRAMPLDPGPHALRAEAEGYAPSEERVVVVEGERQRVLVIRLARAQAPLAAAPRLATQPAPPPAAKPPRRKVPVLPFVLVGVGVTAAAVGAGIHLDGKAREDAFARDAGTGLSFGGLVVLAGGLVWGLIEVLPPRRGPPWLGPLFAPTPLPWPTSP